MCRCKGQLLNVFIVPNGTIASIRDYARRDDAPAAAGATAGLEPAASEPSEGALDSYSTVRVS